MNYTIKRHDTLTAIANRFGTTESAIMAANPQIKSPTLIFEGQIITIPTGTAPPAPAPPSGLIIQ